MSNRIQEQIENLRAELHQHNYAYYIENNPIISDFEFDQKLKTLQTLEKENPEYFDPNSPTQRVGGGLQKDFDTVQHEFRMYSLDNSYNEQDLLDWQTRIEKKLEDQVVYFCELKYDGASISIEYKNGKFIKAVTRGDGQQGDDVSANVRTIRDVPLILNKPYPDHFYIRGEIILPLSGFEKMNEERASENLPLYSNPRNTASGSLKLQDSTETSKRPLECFLYSIVGGNIPYSTQEEMLFEAGRMGFRVPSFSRKCENMKEVLNYLHEWENKRKMLDFETDGVVVKVNQLQQQAELGYTAKSPRWAMAYKFKAEVAETELLSIDYQVGRTGAITPVANLQPVQLSGTIVKRASLHNEDIINQLDVRIGDQVYVEKGGEIIPKIVGVNQEVREENAKAVEFIKNCPECNTQLVREDGEAQHYCPNHRHCPPQIVGALEHYVSRKAMRMESLGKETVKQLYEARLVDDVADFYDLKIEQLMPLARMAEKSAQNILQSVEESKLRPFNKVLFALGIRHVGDTVARKLANHFHSMDALMNASIEELVSVDDIGEKIAISIQAYFQEEENKQIIDRLKKAGIQMEMSSKSTVDKDSPIAGKSFLFTGKLTLFTRDQAQQMVEQNGGINSSSVSKNLNYLVVGEKAGSKLQKAEKLGTVTILNEQEFLDLI